MDSYLILQLGKHLLGAAFSNRVNSEYAHRDSCYRRIKARLAQSLLLSLMSFPSKKLHDG